MDAEVLILGGGISGLSLAWWLAQDGVSVEVWERAEAPGGLIGTLRTGGYAMERAASLMLNFRPEVATLFARCGLDSKKLPLRRNLPRYLVQRGALVRVPMRASSLLFAPLWSRAGRLRLLAEPFVRRGGGERETVSEFVKRRLGPEALEKMFEPLVASTFGCDPDRASARAVLPRLTALEERYGSIVLGACAHKLRRPAGPGLELFSFEGGMQTLIDALANAPGVRLRTQCEAAEIAPAPWGWNALGRGAAGERSARARHLVLSVPAPEAAALLGAEDPELASLLSGIEHAPLAVAHLGFDRKAVRDGLEGVGFLVPRAESRTLLGCQWIGSMFGGRAPQGKLLLSAFLGGARGTQVAAWDETRLADAALRELTPLLGLRASPEMVHVDHHRRGLPLYHGPHLQRVTRIRARLGARRGLHLVANYLDGISTRDRIASAYTAAREICSHLRAAATAKRATSIAAGGAWATGPAAKTTI